MIERKKTRSNTIKTDTVNRCALYYLVTIWYISDTIHSESGMHKIATINQTCLIYNFIVVCAQLQHMIRFTSLTYMYSVWIILNLKCLIWHWVLPEKYCFLSIWQVQNIVLSGKASRIFILWARYCCPFDNRFLFFPRVSSGKTSGPIECELINMIQCIAISLLAIVTNYQMTLPCLFLMFPNSSQQ